MGSVRFTVYTLGPKRIEDVFSIWASSFDDLSNKAFPQDPANSRLNQGYSIIKITAKYKGNQDTVWTTSYEWNREFLYLLFPPETTHSQLPLTYDAKPRRWFRR